MRSIKQTGMKGSLRERVEAYDPKESVTKPTPSSTLPESNVFLLRNDFIYLPDSFQPDRESIGVYVSKRLITYSQAFGSLSVKFRKKIKGW